MLNVDCCGGAWAGRQRRQKHLRIKLHILFVGASGSVINHDYRADHGFVKTARRAQASVGPVAISYPIKSKKELKFRFQLKDVVFQRFQDCYIRVSEEA